MSGLNVIGFTGPKRVGKDTAAAALVENYDWVKINPGDPIRAMVKTLLRHAGAEEKWIRDHVDGDRREDPVFTLDGTDISSRHLMQTLGDDWGRGLVHPDLYASIMLTTTRELLESGVPGVVVTGIRKPNEAAAIRQIGGEIWRIDRPGFEATGEHSSEQGFDAIGHDLRLVNDRTARELHWTILDMYRLRNGIKRQRAAEAGSRA